MSDQTTTNPEQAFESSSSHVSVLNHQLNPKDTLGNYYLHDCAHNAAKAAIEQPENVREKKITVSGAELPFTKDINGEQSEEASTAINFVTAPPVEPTHSEEFRCQGADSCTWAAAYVQQRNANDSVQSLFAKKWDTTFSTANIQHLPEERSYVEVKREQCGEDNGIFIFMEDYEDMLSLNQVDEVVDLCQGVDLALLGSGLGDAGYRRGAWLDDRNFINSGGVRKYENPITATTLHRLLKEPRSGSNDLADADRRLIYIQNLDPWYILALVETAPSHQVPALRNALRGYLEHRTLIQVDIPPSSLTFQLGLRILFYTLRKSQPLNESLLRPANNDPLYQCIDLSFLKIKTKKGQEMLCIHKAQFSLTICGTDDRHWTGYAFVRQNFDGEELEEDCFSYEGVHEDPIASNCRGVDIIDANQPIRDPREYFLTIWSLRMARVWKEWNSLVRFLERCIEQHESNNAPFSPRPETEEEDRINFLKWNRQAMSLLDQLLADLTESVEAWKTFRSTRGDIGYFHSIHAVNRINIHGHSQNSLRALDQVFEKLEILRRRLYSRKEACQCLADALNRRLTWESNRVAHRGVGFSEWTFTIFTPIGFTMSYASLPPQLVPFTMNFKNWLLTMCVMSVMMHLMFLWFDGRLKVVKAGRSIRKIYGRLSSVLETRRGANPKPSLGGVEMDQV